MEDKSPNVTKRLRESGAALHRRETNWQIYFPFLLGILLLVGIFSMVALPSDPIWQDRAQAIGDFLYTLLCIIPILLCLLPIYVMVLLCIYGMRKLHDGTERPLRKLENLTENLASHIETATIFVTEQTNFFSSAIEPYEEIISTFDTPAPDNEEETSSK
jgi:hypothetical protein